MWRGACSLGYSRPPPFPSPLFQVQGDASVEVAWFKYMNKSQLGDPCVLSLKCNGPIDCVAYSSDCPTGACDGFGGRRFYRVGLTVWF